MTSPVLPARATVAPDVLFQELDGESVLLNLRSDRYFGLDDVGTRMWQLVVDHGDLATVLGVLLDDYAVEEAVLQRDLATFIAQLAEAGLLIVDPVAGDGGR